MLPTKSNIQKQPIPGSGSGFTFNPDVVPSKNISDQISEIKLVKQPKLVKEDGTHPSRHLHHWWLFFKTIGGQWIRVDLILAGYRIAWDAPKYKDENRVRDVVPPTCLKVKDIVDTVTKIARAKTDYINPQKIDDNKHAKELKERYSCQDFVKLLLNDLNAIK